MLKINLNTEQKHIIILMALICVCTLFCLDIFVAPPDTAAYYSVARSFVIDGDQNFFNEYEDLSFMVSLFWVTPTGYYSNDWPIGTGLLMSPFMMTAHLVQKVLHLINPAIQTDGYAAMYKIFCALGIIFLVNLAIVVCYKFLKLFSKPSAALTSIILVLFGSPLFFYLLYANYMSHIPGFVFISFFILVWAATISGRTQRHWILLGFLLAISSATRPQNFLTCVVIIPEIIFKLKQHGKSILKEYAAGILILGITFLIGFLPQIAFWKKIYGNAFQFPKMEEMEWLSPYFYSMLFSDYHGIVLWTPLILFSIIGLIQLTKQNPVIGSGLLLLFAIQFYINACNQIWWASGSLGNRRFVDIGIIFIAGIASLLTEKKSGLFLPIFIVCIIWTMLLVSAERAQVITLEHYQRWNPEFFSGLFTFASNPLRVIVSLKGGYSGAPWLFRILSSIMLFVICSAVYIIYEKKTLSGKLSFNSYKHPAFLTIIIWLIISVFFYISLLRTNVPDKSKVIPKLRYKPASLWNNYYEMGYYHLIRMDFEKAETAFIKAIDIDNNQPMPYRYLGSMYLIEKDFNKAVFYLEKAVKLFPQYIQAKTQLAKTYETILEDYPNDPGTREKLRLLNEDVEKSQK